MPPTVAGVCNQDMVNIITPTQTAMEVGAVALCGTLTGQHCNDFISLDSYFTP